MLASGEIMPKVLIIEDDEALLDNMSEWLAADRYTVETASNGDDGLYRMRFYPFDVIILDWDLPGSNGIEICRQYRDSGGNTPILMLTGKSTVKEKRTGLDSGADDYLTKPFDLEELTARLRALMRRPASSQSSQLKARDIVLDTATGVVTKAGAEIHLMPKEFALLEFFLRNQNQLFSADALLNNVWSSEDDPCTTDTIRPYIKRLRSKIDDGADSLIVNVHGMGYKLVP
jgi:DNA-binding response OmpR family regulator